MLNDRLHGLHVTRALRLVDPGIPAVLMTGFPSEDLLCSAGACGSCELLPKPFRLARLLEAIRRAEARRRLPTPTSDGGVGIIEVDRRGRIAFENPAASAILDRVRRPWRGVEESLDEMFRPGDREKLQVAGEHWIELSPMRNQALRWALRARALPDHDRRVFALCRASDHTSRSDPWLKMLLGIGNATPHRWPFEGRVLLIGGETDTRARAVESLELAGCTCFSVASAALALRLLAADDGIHYAVLDCTGPEAEVRQAVVGIRDIRPDVALIGSLGSRPDDREIEADVQLARGWTPADLIQAVALHGRDVDLSSDRKSRWAEASLSPVRDSRSAPRSSSLRRVRI
jgi:DNA-binding response OmpR family regulator